MAGKSPRGDNTKKAAQLSLKDKRRALKREKGETTPFIKPRKGA